MTGPADRAAATCRVLICSRCSRPGSDRDIEPRDGGRLLDAVRTALGASDDPSGMVEVLGVACLSNCNRACSVAFTGPGKISYLYGDKDIAPEAAEDVLAMARLHAASTDGITVRAERPESFRKGLVGRVPPFDFEGEPLVP